MIKVSQQKVIYSLPQRGVGKREGVSPNNLRTQREVAQETASGALKDVRVWQRKDASAFWTGSLIRVNRGLSIFSGV
jgi:hypothetical protein